jgi:hypothetical protein
MHGSLLEATVESPTLSFSAGLDHVIPPDVALANCISLPKDANGIVPTELATVSPDTASLQ